MCLGCVNVPKAHVVRAWVSAYDTVLCGLSALRNFDRTGLNLSYLYEIIITLVSIKLFEAYLKNWSKTLHSRKE